MCGLFKKNNTWQIVERIHVQQFYGLEIVRRYLLQDLHKIKYASFEFLINKAKKIYKHAVLHNGFSIT